MRSRRPRFVPHGAERSGETPQSGCSDVPDREFGHRGATETATPVSQSGKLLCLSAGVDLLRPRLPDRRLDARNACDIKGLAVCSDRRPCSIQGARQERCRAQAMHTCNTVQRNTGLLKSFPPNPEGGHTRRAGFTGIFTLATERARKLATATGESYKQSTARRYRRQALHFTSQSLHCQPASVRHFEPWERSSKPLPYPNQAAAFNLRPTHHLARHITTRRAQGLQTTRASSAYAKFHNRLEALSIAATQNTPTMRSAYSRASSRPAV